MPDSFKKEDIQGFVAGLRAKHATELQIAAWRRFFDACARASDVGLEGCAIAAMLLLEGAAQLLLPGRRDPLSRQDVEQIVNEWTPHPRVSEAAIARLVANYATSVVAELHLPPEKLLFGKHIATVVYKAALTELDIDAETLGLLTIPRVFSETEADSLGPLLSGGGVGARTRRFRQIPKHALSAAAGFRAGKAVKIPDEPDQLACAVANAVVQALKVAREKAKRDADPL